MKKCRVLFFVLLGSIIQSINAQDDFAIIKDKDGYTNVREADINSQIVGRVSDNQIYDCMESEDVGGDIVQNMVYINYFNYIPKKDSEYSQNELIRDKDGWIETDPQAGYIHKSRIQRLKELPRFKNTYASRHKATYEYKNIVINFEFKDFDPRKHILKNSEGQIVREEANNDFVSLSSIYDDPIWGVDGTMPRTEIESITIQNDGSVINLPRNSLKNIFEPYVEGTIISIGPDKAIYIWMPNGDGAASYNVIWVITDNKLKYKFVQLGYYV